MSVLQKIACFQKRRDEVPNQELARELAGTRNLAGIQEIAAHLWDKNPNVQSDCLKVLYEIGFLEPALIAAYAEDFVKLTQHKQNRLVWGGMIALSTIAGLKAAALFKHVDLLKAALNNGSVITVDNAVKTLALIAASDAKYNQAIFPHLLAHLAHCRPKDVPQHSEKTLVAVTSRNRAAFIATLEKRVPELTNPQAARVGKVIKRAATQ